MWECWKGACALVKSKASIDVWVMQDYGVRESWSKCYSITDERIMNNDELSLVYLFKNGHMLFSALSKVFSYDPKHGSVRELNIQSIFGSGEIFCDRLYSLAAGTWSRRGHEGSTETEKKKKIKK